MKKQADKERISPVFFLFRHGITRISRKNYGSRSKKGEFLRFELSHNALNRKPRK